jgi:YVTN family beta-propeller protein
VISTASNTVTATISVGNRPYGVAVTPNGAYVYVTNFAENSVSVISTASNTVTATISVGNWPYVVAVTPNGAYVYVTNYLDNSVSVISTASNTVTATISVGNWPYGVAVTPNGAYVYVTNYADNSVSVISTSTNTVTATINVGTYPSGVAVTPNGAYVYVPNSADNSVSVIDTTPSFAISVSQGTHGTISPGTTTVNYGGSQAFTFTPATGYHVADVLMNGTSVLGSVTDGAYTVSDVTGATTLTATYAINTYAVSVSQGDYGIISPSTTTVNYGSGQDFTFTPATGYHIVAIIVNGTTVATTSPYTISDVTGPTSLTAEYAINTYAITVSQGTHGTISPGTTTVNYGSGQDFTFTPATGYHLTDVLMNGTSVMEDVENGAYTVSDVTGSTSLTATFAIDVFTVTVGDHTHGSISSANGTSVNYGDDLSFSVTPNTGYHLVSVLIDDQTATAPYNFVNVTAAHIISATFAIDTYVITVTQSVNGVIAPSTTTVDYGSSQEFTITPHMGYHISSLVVDGSTGAVASTYTFSNVQNDHSITAIFTADTLTATVTTTGETYPVEISGNVTTEQFSNMTITPYQDTKTTSVDFTITGPNGTEGFCNLTLPKIAIPFGTNPIVYIDGIVAENQSFIEDSDNYYIAFTTHFSTHQIEILFTTESTTYIPTPITNWGPSQTSNTSPNPTTKPTPTIPPTPTPTPRPTTNPTSTPKTTLATMGQYVIIAAAIVILGAVIIGLVQRRKRSTKAPLK